jgi:hypothetical protein
MFIVYSVHLFDFLKFVTDLSHIIEWTVCVCVFILFIIVHYNP